MHMLEVDLLLPLGILLQLDLGGRTDHALVSDGLHVLLLDRVDLLLQGGLLRLQFVFVLGARLVVIVEVLRLRAACLTRLLNGVEHR